MLDCVAKQTCWIAGGSELGLLVGMTQDRWIVGGRPKFFYTFLSILNILPWVQTGVVLDCWQWNLVGLL